MAVIREKQQFRNSRIGVVRMDTGESQMWQTVASAADSLTQQAFKQASVEARKKGKEFAESVGEESLRTIDPATGKPQAFKAPSNFGTIAQAAYEETLDRRYIRTVDREIRDKANETYLKYEFDPQGVEKYSQVMEDYVSGMTKNADKRFEGIVRDTGAAYIASTKFNLMQKRNLRIKEAEQIAQRDDAKDNASFIESMAENVDWSLPDSQGHRDVEDMYMEGVAGQRAANVAGLISDAQYEANVGIMRRALPKAILSKMINFDAVYEKEDGSTVQINSDVALSIENSLKTNRVLDEVPTALKPQVQRILDSEAYDKDRDNIARHVTALRTNLSVKESDAVKLTAFQQLVLNVADPNFVNDTKDPSVKKAGDVLIANEVDSLDPANPNMVPYFTSEESTKEDAPWKIMVAGKGIITEGMELTLKRLYRLEGMTKEQLEIGLSHYDYLANVNIAGSTVNKTLDTTLSNDENAFLRTLSYVTRVGGSENIVEFAAKLKENMQNTSAVNDRVKSVLGDGSDKSANDLLNAYLQGDNDINESTAFGTDYQMVETVKPYVKHLIMSGVGKKDLNEQLNQMFETSYIDTVGVVVDRYNSQIDKSMFALPRLLPDYAERQAFYGNATELVQALSGKDFVMREKGQYLGIEKNRQIKLVPMTTSAFQPDVLPLEYKIDDDLSEEGFVTRNSSLQTFQYIAHYVDDDGQLRMIPDKNGSPIFIGTELAYGDIAELRKTQSQDEMYDVNKKTLRKIEINKRTQARIKRNIEALSNIPSPLKGDD